MSEESRLAFEGLSRLGLSDSRFTQPHMGIWDVGVSVSHSGHSLRNVSEIGCGQKDQIENRESRGIVGDR